MAPSSLNMGVLTPVLLLHTCSTTIAAMPPAAVTIISVAAEAYQWCKQGSAKEICGDKPFSESPDECESAGCCKWKPGVLYGGSCVSTQGNNGGESCTGLPCRYPAADQFRANCMNPRCLKPTEDTFGGWAKKADQASCDLLEAGRRRDIEARNLRERRECDKRKSGGGN